MNNNLSGSAKFHQQEEKPQQKATKQNEKTPKEKIKKVRAIKLVRDK